MLLSGAAWRRGVEWGAGKVGLLKKASLEYSHIPILPRHFAYFQPGACPRDGEEKSFHFLCFASCAAHSSALFYARGDSRSPRVGVQLRIGRPTVHAGAV
jgi:hypothetical protein